MEAYRLGNESDNVFMNVLKLRGLVDQKNQEGKDLLNEAYMQQDRIDELLSDIYSVKDKADEWLNSWNVTLTEKESIYKDLKG